MTTILTKVQQYLNSDNIDRAREEVDKILDDLTKVDVNVQDFAALLALGPQKDLEIGLGVLGRELLKPDISINNEVIWLFLSVVLSRSNITPDSPSRISFLGLVSRVEDWELPIFALLTPALDSFLKVSLSSGNVLIAEQTLDFIATWGDNYAKAPHLKKQLKNIKSLTDAVLEQVDDLELQEELQEELETFFKRAKKTQYADDNIWSAGGNLLKKIYNTQVLDRDLKNGNHARVKEGIQRLITSSLAAIGQILDSKSLSAVVRIDNADEINNFWNIRASIIDRVERFFQEIVDENDIKKLLRFRPVWSFPGSWTVILHIPLGDNQSELLANAIASLSNIKYGDNAQESLVVNSWRDCVKNLKEDNLRVDIAVSSNDPELHIIRSISTEDVPISEDFTSQVRVLSRDIPQANNLERVIELASIFIQHPSSLSTVRQQFLAIFGIAPRQFSYYRRAVEILGLVDERERPTTAGRVLHHLSETEKIGFLAHQFISSKVGWAWLNWQNVNTLAEIEPEGASTFVKEVCPSLSDETGKRRADTLKSWLKVFATEKSNI
ncbi:hypothetical protein [Spirulina sp. 06S082]|uniref:hypothetical protein n=1 Tax=Spirulina sp. 06S082 TaxID=3110248 RepID=UPI002B1F2218|nr:hypothetical protein [Spirulina sp. 06S082]MEA5469590.1 hypothetical protein [Spirulina sp. 06S082]